MARSDKQEHFYVSCSESTFDHYHECCQICKLRVVNPRVLSCLHIFCEQCLVKLCRDSTYMQNDNYQLTCPLCNKRVTVFLANGSFKFQFGKPGKEEECLWYPRKVAAMLKSKKRIVVSDQGVERIRFQIFSACGTFLRKVPFFDVGSVSSLAITEEEYIAIADNKSQCIYIINELGELIRRLNCSRHIIEPSDMAIYGTEFFICDFRGHRVGVFNEAGGFKGYLRSKKPLNYPCGIDVSKRGNVFVSSSDNNQFELTQFNRDGTFVMAYKCEGLKVSRCRGLRLNTNEQLITLSFIQD